MRTSAAIGACLLAAAVLSAPAALAQTSGGQPDEPDAVKRALVQVTALKGEVTRVRARLDAAARVAAALEREHDALVREQIEAELGPNGERRRAALAKRMADLRERIAASDARRAKLEEELAEVWERLERASEGVEQAWVKELAGRANALWPQVESASAALDAAVAAAGRAGADDEVAGAAVEAATAELARATAAHQAAVDQVTGEVERQGAEHEAAQRAREQEAALAVDRLRDAVEHYAGLRVQERHFASLAELVGQRGQSGEPAARTARAQGAEADGVAAGLARSSSLVKAMVDAEEAAGAAAATAAAAHRGAGPEASAAEHEAAAADAQRAAAAALRANAAASEVYEALYDEDAGAFMEDLATLGESWHERADDLAATQLFHLTQAEVAQLRAAAGHGDQDAAWELSAFLERWLRNLDRAVELAGDHSPVRLGEVAEARWADRLVELERQLAVVREELAAARGVDAEPPGLPAELAAALDRAEQADPVRRAEDRADLLADALGELRRRRSDALEDEAQRRSRLGDLLWEAVEAEADGDDLAGLQRRIAEELARIGPLRRAGLTLDAQVEQVQELLEDEVNELAGLAARAAAAARGAAARLRPDSGAAELRSAADLAVAAAEAARRAKAAAERQAAAYPDDALLAADAQAAANRAERAAKLAAERVRRAEKAERRELAALERRAGNGDRDAARKLLGLLERRRAELDGRAVIEPGAGAASPLTKERAALEREAARLREQLGEPPAEGGAEPAAETPPPTGAPEGGDQDGKDTKPAPEASLDAEPEAEPGQGGAEQPTEPPDEQPAIERPGGRAQGFGGVVPGHEQDQQQRVDWVPDVGGAKGEDEGVGGLVSGPVLGALGAGAGCGPGTAGVRATCAPARPAPGGDPCAGLASLVIATCAPKDPSTNPGPQTEIFIDPFAERDRRLIFTPPDGSLDEPEGITLPDPRPPGGTCGIAGDVVVTCGGQAPGTGIDAFQFAPAFGVGGTEPVPRPQDWAARCGMAC